MGARVTVLDNLTRGFRHYIDTDRVDLVEGDIGDPAAVERALRGIDTVIQLAAYGSVVESIADPETNFRINAQGTLTLLQGAREAGVDRFVFASTGGAIMGDAPPPVNEESVPRPISPYGASKLCGEAYCHAFAGSYGLRTIMLRFGNVYGSWSAHKKGAVTVFIKALLTGDPIRIYGDGTASRDLLHVDDLCNGILRAATSDLPAASTLHLASGMETTVAGLADHLKAIAGVPDHPGEYLPGRVGEVSRNFADATAAERLLGFRAERDFDEGMRATWEWFRDNRATVLATQTSDS
jgi:UDP-glucose 4-epimerase